MAGRGFAGARLGGKVSGALSKTLRFPRRVRARVDLNPTSAKVPLNAGRPGEPMVGASRFLRAQGNLIRAPR